MKLNQKLIEQLRDGEIAVKNDGTLEELRQVLSEAFTRDASKTDGLNIFYYQNYFNAKEWDFSHHTLMPSKSVKDFFVEEEEFQWGDDVEVSNTRGNNWMKAKYVARSTYNKDYPYIAEQVDSIRNGCTYWERVRKPLITIEMTKQQIADKFGYSVDQIVIKD